MLPFNSNNSIIAINSSQILNKLPSPKRLFGCSLDLPTQKRISPEDYIDQPSISVLHYLHHLFDSGAMLVPKKRFDGSDMLDRFYNFFGRAYYRQDLYGHRSPVLPKKLGSRSPNLDFVIPMATAESSSQLSKFLNFESDFEGMNSFALTNRIAGMRPAYEINGWFSPYSMDQTCLNHCGDVVNLLPNDQFSLIDACTYFNGAFNDAYFFLMLDFMIPNSDENVQLVRDSFQRCFYDNGFDISGFLVESSSKSEFHEGGMHFIETGRIHNYEQFLIFRDLARKFNFINDKKSFPILDTDHLDHFSIPSNDLGKEVYHPVLSLISRPSYLFSANALRMNSLTQDPPKIIDYICPNGLYSKISSQYKLYSEVVDWYITNIENYNAKDPIAMII